MSAFYGAGGWYFSNLIHSDALRATPYDPSDLQGGTIQALAIDQQAKDGQVQGQVTLRPDNSEPKFDPAVVGLVAGNSIIVAGPALVTANGIQTRQIREVVGAIPKAGSHYGLTRDVWLDPSQAGLQYREMGISTPEGEDFPAWLIPGTGARKWAVLAHGKGGSRSEMLRIAQPLHGAGYNVLIISYRGDVGAPQYPDGMVTYGRSEWRELEAAVDFAQEAGAERIVLGGASHGGAVTLGFLRRSQIASEIDALILDAPASSLSDVLDEAAMKRTLPLLGVPIPRSLVTVAKAMTAWRFNINFSEIDYSHSDQIQIPLIVFQGTEDRTVEQGVNDKFMANAGAKGEYVLVPNAGHVLAWNIDPEAFDRHITQFLSKLG